jgi:hypothetical protein
MRLGLPTVRSNHERQLLSLPRSELGLPDAFAKDTLSAEQLAWIGGMPKQLMLNNGVFLFHGTPASDLEHLLETVEPDGRRVATASEVEDRLLYQVSMIGTHPYLHRNEAGSLHA